MKGQTDEDASEQEEEDSNREISLKARRIYRGFHNELTKVELQTRVQPVRTVSCHFNPLGHPVLPHRPLSFLLRR